ncbi:glycosyltransferase family 2 protein [Thermodesulfobacteriota bacterium]
MNKVVVFIPAYNEEKIIGEAIDKTRELYPEKITAAKNYYVEILVVNDGSTDKTEEIVREKGAKMISHARNLGLGAATRTAMEYAHEGGAAVAVKLDADLQHDPDDIEKVITPILEDRADICWGSRFAGSINYKMPFIRFIGNKFFTWLMNNLTEYRISDAQTGLMAYGRKYLKVFELHGNYNPPQQLLIDASNKYMRYAEVPVTFNKRNEGESFVDLKYPFKVIPNILRVITFANPLKIFGIMGLSMMFVSFTVSMLWLLNIIVVFPDTTVLLLFLSGLQTLFFGVLADLIIKKRK